jgi:hypothetical protein
MNEDKGSRAIYEIESGLACDDPAFVQRMRRLQRRDDESVLCVFALLAAGTVLLILALATLAWPMWVAASGAFAGSVSVNVIHKRSLRKALGP